MAVCRGWCLLLELQPVVVTSSPNPKGKDAVIGSWVNKATMPALRRRQVSTGRSQKKEKKRSCRHTPLCIPSEAFDYRQIRAQPEGES